MDQKLAFELGRRLGLHKKAGLGISDTLSDIRRQQQEAEERRRRMAEANRAASARSQAAFNKKYAPVEFTFNNAPAQPTTPEEFEATLAQNRNMRVVEPDARRPANYVLRESLAQPANKPVPPTKSQPGGEATAAGLATDAESAAPAQTPAQTPAQSSVQTPAPPAQTPAPPAQIPAPPQRSGPSTGRSQVESIAKEKGITLPPRKPTPRPTPRAAPAPVAKPAPTTPAAAAAKPIDTGKMTYQQRMQAFDDRLRELAQNEYTAEQWTSIEKAIGRKYGPYAAHRLRQYATEQQVPEEARDVLSGLEEIFPGAGGGGGRGGYMPMSWNPLYQGYNPQFMGYMAAMNRGNPWMGMMPFAPRGAGEMTPEQQQSAYDQFAQDAGFGNWGERDMWDRAMELMASRIAGRQGRENLVKRMLASGGWS